MKTKFKETEIGPIPDGWSVFKIQDVADVVGGGTPSTKVQENFGGDIPWITPRDLSTHKGRYISKGERNLSQKGLKASSAKLLPVDSVLLTTRAPVGYLAIASSQVTTNQGFRSMILNDRTDSLFLYYLLTHNKQKLIDNASGSTFQELSGSVLKSLKFAFPELSEQKAIAEILSSLDDKIELNRQMNKIIESIAQALFKQWFVDFEFPDKHGKPYKSNGGKMVKSELGMIPEGWRSELFSDTIDVFSGGTPKTTVSDYWGGAIPWFSIGDVSNVSDVYVISTQKHVTKKGIDSSAAEILPTNTTILTARGTVGRVALTGVPMAINQSCYGLRGKYEKNGYFTYFRTRDLVSVLKQRTHGAVFDTITRETLTSFSVTTPQAKLIDDFESTIQPCMEMLQVNLKQSGSLKKTRDSLLPRLMAGMIRVSN